MRSMNAAPRLTFDSNILIYAADREGGDRHELARMLVASAARADCVLSVQALAEFFAVATRKTGVSTTAAIALVDGWQAMFKSISATPATLGAAMAAIRDHKLSFWDAMLWAVAREAGCRYILSEDFQSGRTLGGVTFVNPFIPRGLPAPLDRALATD